MSSHCSLKSRSTRGLACVALLLSFDAEGASPLDSESEPGGAAGIVSIGCGNNVTIPQLYQRSFVLNTKDFTEWPLFANVSVVSDAVITEGSSILTDHPSVGVVSRMCFKSVTVDPTDHFLVAAEVSISTNFSCCVRLRFKPLRPEIFQVLYSVQFQEHSMPPCDTEHHQPNRLIGGDTGPVSNSTHLACASSSASGSVIPEDLIRVPVRHLCHVPLTRETVPCHQGFIGGGWFVVSRSPSTRLQVQSESDSRPPWPLQSVLQDETDMCYCALNTTSLPPALAGLPGVSQLWQVVFGDPKWGERTACGWWARVGSNLTYIVHWEKTMECPTTMFNDSSLVVLPNYWAAPESPTQTATPTLSLSASESPAQSPSLTRSQTQSTSPSQSASSSDRPSSGASAAFSFLGLSGSAAVGVVLALCVGAVTFAVAVALILRRRCAVGVIEYSKVIEAGAGAPGSMGPTNASVNASGAGEYELPEY